MRKRMWLWLAALCALPALAQTQTPWQRITQPVAGAPQAIGSYANGCIIGAQALPLTSENYQVMRSDQRRYFGHPTLLAFVARLGAEARAQRLGTLLIGDMAMPAGGRFNGGHASHQSGLDVDIWLQLPHARWTPQQLRQPVPQDLVAVGADRVIPSRWTPQVAELIRLAAQDPQVTRIFVNPAIKRQLCDTAGGDRAWLHKVRPWFAHRAHMHVRLRCPPGSAACEAQTPPPAGDGCGAELASWFQPPPPHSAPAKPQTPPPLPPACQALLTQLHG
ncbi:penicillin-insensitive murein endopeptidase [Edwardsiella piscicida]|uniref:Murein endopeptidase n=2 Tax=Edwardsiella TaxID=635 RepID=A0A0H3DWK2_EDWTF|nr:penicillin-insensitive murein endopeptidase [Edwardsiella tarda EIB202]ADM42319.1 Murein endopeptidase [Edwardsiella tarda FL6-60]QBB13350.1 penicillin-insensitive murein endopeptidase [Edwardsiella piscicida]QHR94770.1 penicillin-insensitive murein endopeptidase [Edwardsiella piscicida]GAJ63782.1 murein endopeptidase [Edwardsiella piscicida]